MKKIFILTGEPSGDKLASEVISKLKNNNTNIEYLSVGGSNLRNLGIQSISLTRFLISFSQFRSNSLIIFLEFFS